MLQMQKEQFLRYAKEDPDKLRSIMSPYLENRRRLYERYSRGSTPAEVMRAGVPLEFYITKIAQGYLAGKEPTYTVKGERDTTVLSDYIDDIRRYNDDGATYSDLMLLYLTTGAAYLYVYENEKNEIVYNTFDPRQTLAVYDYNVPPNMIGCLRSWTETEENKTVQVLEVMTDEERGQWRDKTYTLTEKLHWGDIPVTACEEPDGMAIYSPVLHLIDVYEQLQRNLASMTQYNDNAKLMLRGYGLRTEKYIYQDGKEVPNPERKREEDALYNAIVLQVDTDGDITWLLKDVSYDGVLAVMKRLHDNITMLTGVPNMTDEAFSNADNASALGYKLYALDQYSSLADRIFRKAYMRLWELILGRKKLVLGEGDPSYGTYDFRDITITMNRNIPTDRDKSIARARDMYNGGLFSQETCIRESGVEVDPAEEMERKAAEDEEKRQKLLEMGYATIDGEGTEEDEQAEEEKNTAEKNEKS